MQCVDASVLVLEYSTAFIHLQLRSTLTCVGETLSMESMWSLALVVKSVVVATADGERGSSVSASLYQHQFVECISYLAQLGTGLSRKWIVEDLEVFTVNCC